MRVYIAGKVSGLDRDRAELKFWSTETVLTEKGFEVINPVSGLAKCRYSKIEF